MNSRKLIWALAALLLVGAAGFAVWKSKETRGSASAAAEADRGADPSVGATAAMLDTKIDRQSMVRPRRLAAEAAESRQLGKVAGLADTDSSGACLFGPTARCAELVGDLTACDGGDGQACMRVADELGQKPPRDLTVERALRAKACKNGVAEACADVRERKELLASLKDDPEARERATSSCQQDGDPIACHALVKHHEYDDDRGPAQAARKKMCELGFDRRPGCIEFSLYAEQPEEAGWALDSACKAGSPDACQLLAHHYLGFTANPAGISDLDRALAAYGRACELAPDHKACAEGDVVRETGGLPEDL